METDNSGEKCVQMCSHLLRQASNEKQCLLVDIRSKDSYNALI
jgi:hypothetical protein